MSQRPLARLWGYLFSNPDPARRLTRRLELHPLEAREVPATLIGTGVAAYAGAVAIPQHTAWTAAPEGGSWVFAPDPDEDYYYAAGTYTFSTTFDLAAGDVAGARLDGGFAADNEVVMLLNGTEVAATPPVWGFTGLTPFSVSGGFQAGTNTLTFVVTNQDDPSPAGLLVTGQVSQNRLPVAVADTAETDSGTAVAVDVLANDTDADGDALTLLGVGTAEHGTVAVVDGQAVYTPAAGYVGTDSFTYTISDGHGGTATGTVTVTVTELPTVSVSLYVAASEWDVPTGGRGPGSFRFTRTGSTSQSLTVEFAVTGDAAEGSDYQALARSVTFDVGESYVDLLVTPLADQLVESAESVTLTLTPSTNYTVVGEAATVAINDAAPASVAGHVWYDFDLDGNAGTGEGDLTGVTVTLSGPNGQTWTTTTDAAGGYEFTNLQAGAYTVQVTPPSGMHATTVTGDTFALDVRPGDDYGNIDFGLAGPLPIVVEYTTVTLTSAAGSLQVTVTVTYDKPGYEGLDFWEYRVTNLDYGPTDPSEYDPGQRAGSFSVPVGDISDVSNLTSSLGWLATATAGSGITWDGSAAADPDDRYILPGQTVVFSFTTQPRTLTQATGEFGDSSALATSQGIMPTPWHPGEANSLQDQLQTLIREFEEVRQNYNEQYGRMRLLEMRVELLQSERSELNRIIAAEQLKPAPNMQIILNNLARALDLKAQIDDASAGAALAEREAFVSRLALQLKIQAIVELQSLLGSSGMVPNVVLPLIVPPAP